MRPSKGSRKRSPSIPAVGVLVVGDDCRVCVRFLGPYSGLLSHWLKKQPTACPGPPECLPAVHNGSTVFRAYAPVLEWIPASAHWLPAVLQITEHLEEVLRGRALRGEEWIISRPRIRRAGNPLEGELRETLDPDLLPEPFDFKAVVARYYHAEAIKWDVKNPLPARVRLEPVNLPAPSLPADMLNTAEPAGATEKREAAAARWKELRGKRGEAQAEAEPLRDEEAQAAHQSTGRAAH